MKITGNHQYYTFIASLPPLPRFDRAARLPINRERLRQRHSMLTPKDADLLEHASEFLSWQRQTAARTDEEMTASFRRMQSHIDHPVLQSLFAFPIDQRTVMAALRRRHRGAAAPAPGEQWGVGRFVRHMENNWDEPSFGLAAVFPWVPRARAHIEADEAFALERLVNDLLWDHVDRWIQPFDFGFGAVLAYIFKWDILDRWLSHNVEDAKVRFEELVAEVTDEQQQLVD